MKTAHSVPVTLIESEGERSLPPGGGLAIAVAGSLVFWAVTIWMVLQ